MIRKIWFRPNDDDSQKSNMSSMKGNRTNGYEWANCITEKVACQPFPKSFLVKKHIFLKFHSKKTEQSVNFLHYF